MRRSPEIRDTFQLRRTVATILALSALAAATCGVASAAETDEAVTLSDVSVTEDALRAFSTEPSASSFGFAKPLLETPRTVAFLSEEQLSLYGVSTIDDLARLVPGTYTTTRYGLQGGISVRGVSADFYYRGMRRLQMQGHVRTVLSAYDNIEVVKGPPSPLYGMGQIGGYANLDPKSSRAKTGKYLSDSNGYFEATHDTYNKNEAQFGLGVPFSVLDHPAGVYVVGLIEDSQTFIRNVGAKQKFLQAASSVDNVGPFRVEFGGQMQNSITSGAYMNRVTQNLVDNGIYIAGMPLANLDLNGDGRVAYVETQLASPVTGAITASNRALSQRYTVPANADGTPKDLSTFANTIVGIPKSMKDYLTTGAGAGLNCPMANYMRTTAPVAALGGLYTQQLPVGFVLNPCQVKQVKFMDADYRRNGSFEREQNATQQMGYLDFIYDTDPNFTVKNQVYFDSLQSFKDSWLPYGEQQAIHALEDKVTATYKLSSGWLPDWLAVNTLGSLNRRKNWGNIRSSGGDFDSRQDVLYTTAVGTGAEGSGTGGHVPNTMFWTQLTNPSYATGALDTTTRYSKYTETGVGLMADVTFFDKTNLLVGGRKDSVKARVYEPSTFNESAGNIGTPTSAFLALYSAGLVCQAAPTAATGPCPGVLNNQANIKPVASSDSGTSYSASLSHELPWGKMRPYVTLARSTITLDGSNNLYSASTVAGGKLVGAAKLKEFGIKGELFSGKAQWTVAGFQQERTDVTTPTDPSLSAFATSTSTKGIESSFNWQPIRTLTTGASLTFMQPKFTTPLTTANTQNINTRLLGFQDIVLPTGEVFPAEAFGYGGNMSVVLSDVKNTYDDVPGIPKWQASANASYAIGKGFGLLVNGQYVSQVWADRLKTELLPDSIIWNAGLTWDHKRVHLKVNVYNLTDELSFRAGIFGAPNLVSVLPLRRYEATLKMDF